MRARGSPTPINCSLIHNSTVLRLMRIIADLSAFGGCSDIQMKKLKSIIVPGHIRKEATVPKVTIAQNILAANDTIAEEIQQQLAALGIRTINVMSSPGAGKTTLLERTIERLRGQLDIGVIEGDIETSADAERIEAAGAETVQINTRGACHLEAHMIRDALSQMDLALIELLI